MTFLSYKTFSSNILAGLGFRPMANDTEALSIIWYNKTTKDSWITTMKEFVNSKYQCFSTEAGKNYLSINFQ